MVQVNNLTKLNVSYLLPFRLGDRLQSRRVSGCHRWNTLLDATMSTSAIASQRLSNEALCFMPGPAPNTPISRGQAVVIKGNAANPNTVTELPRIFSFQLSAWAMIRTPSTTATRTAL